MLLYLRGVNRILASLTILSVLISSCVKEQDNEKPVVSIITPAEDDIVYTDDDLYVIADMTDNTGILQYKLVLSGIDSLNDIGSDSTYSTIFIDAANEQTVFSLDQYLDLPSTTFNGHYQLLLSCVDVEGNESFKDTVLIVLRNNADYELPVFNVGGVNSGDTLILGSGISPSGTITDVGNLSYASFYLGRTNGSDTIQYFEFPVIQNNMVEFDGIGWYFQVDSSWTKGAYHMYYTAWDGYSGVSHSIPFYVKY
jgi:hypothetical protein